jgi:phosphohistidine phosphatase SixA
MASAMVTGTGRSPARRGARRIAGAMLVALSCAIAPPAALAAGATVSSGVALSGASGAAGAAAKDNENAAWSLLQQGGQVVLMRHARTEPGIGDPAGFKAGVCETQRNLSVAGRDDAAKLAAEFARRRIAVQEVLSSRWCRCLDTAQLAFGQVRPAPMLDSVFGDIDTGMSREEKGRAVVSAVTAFHGPGNLIMVTHDRNIHALTGVSPASGEMVLVASDGKGGLKPVGQLTIP